MYTPLHIKEINYKDLLYSTGNCIQYLVIIHDLIYITESLCCIPETKTTLLIIYTSVNYFFCRNIKIGLLPQCGEHGGERTGKF